MWYFDYFLKNKEYFSQKTLTCVRTALFLLFSSVPFAYMLHPVDSSAVERCINEVRKCLGKGFTHEMVGCRQYLAMLNLRSFSRTTSVGSVRGVLTSAKNAVLYSTFSFTLLLLWVDGYIRQAALKINYIQLIVIAFVCVFALFGHIYHVLDYEFRYTQSLWPLKRVLRNVKIKSTSSGTTPSQ